MTVRRNERLVDDTLEMNDTFADVSCSLCIFSNSSAFHVVAILLAAAMYDK